MKIIKNILGIFILSLCIVHNAQAQNIMPSFADLAERLLPSVVNISTTHDKADVSEETSDIDNHIETTVDSIFNAPSTNKISLGSGFIISEDGYIITNHHVIDKAQSISVTLFDNSSYEAKVIGSDSKTDTALIKIDVPKKLKAVTFGDSDKIRIGDWILAIGNPFGLGGSVTAGIVSAKSRDIESGPYDSFIQTDASINQGSSGGPMFNMDGEVIGINTAIFSTNGGSMGVGFAVPVNLVDFVIKQLKANGEVKRGWIGIKMQPYSADIAQSLGESLNQGVIVSSVSENSSAINAGIQAGDIIIKFDNNIINSTKNFSRMVAEAPIGKNIEIQIQRNGQIKTLQVLIEEMPKDDSIKPSLPVDNPEPIDNPPEESSDFEVELGISVENINPETAERFNINADEQGVVITSVAPDSDAALKGVKAGNLLLQIDKKIILDKNDVSQHIQNALRENRRPILLQIKDGEILHFVAVKFYPNKNRNIAHD